MKFSYKLGNLKMLISLVLTYIFFIYIAPLFTIPFSKNYSLFYLLNVITGTIGLLAMLYLAKKYTNSIDTNPNKISLLTAIGIGILGFFAVTIFQGILNVLLQFASQFFEFNPNSQNTNNILTILKHQPLFALYVVIIGPAMEELVFRKAIFGYLYDAMQESNDNVRFVCSAIITGILFAIPHDGFSPIMIIYIIMSLVFSFIYVKTKRLLPSIITHVLMNFFVIVVQLFFNS